MTTASTDRPATFDAAALASQWGLERVGARPPLRTYLKEAWRRRHFATELAKSKVVASTAENSLGILWELLNPLLLAGVYYFAFGLLLGTHKDSSNFIAFLLCGVLSWYLINRSIRQGALAITGNRTLIRSMHFPRIILPVSVVLRQMLSFYTNFLIIAAATLITGEGVRWTWLIAPINVVLMGIFASGAAMIAAWAVSHWKDFNDFLPFILRMWMYFTGIFFSVHIRYMHAPHWVQLLAFYNPGAVYLQIMRHAFIREVPVYPLIYMWAVVWAFLFIVVGSIVFWRAEEHYGSA